MALLDELKKHLALVHAGLRREPGLELNVSALRAHLLLALERREQKDANDDATQQSILAIHERLGDPVRFETYIRVAADELMSGLCATSTPSSLHAAVREVIDCHADVAGPGQTLARRLELIRVAELASSAVERSPTVVPIEPYAAELQLTSRRRGTELITPLGETLLGLAGRDAVAWILLVETRQSLGVVDPWRVCSEALAWLLRQREWIEVGHYDEPWCGRFRFDGLRRLTDLGVVMDESVSPQEDRYTLNPACEEMLRELVEARPTPLSLLADSLLNEARDSLAPGGARTVDRSAEVYARHARMVVHEIRNAMLPVENALSSLYRELDERGVDTRTLPQPPRITRGIERVFTFVGELQKVAALGAPAEPFDPWAALADARASLNGGVTMDLAVEPPDGSFRLHGNRARFTLVFTNLLRNATQCSVSPKVTVRVTLDLAADGERVLIAVDDDGPGVPEEHREAIFSAGYAMRSGGSGHGLALVREVVEVEMGGQVRCEAGSRGGARFVMALPQRRQV